MIYDFSYNSLGLLSKITITIAGKTKDFEVNYSKN
jgi:hypothetical protein